MWDLLGARLKPEFPALVGGFSTTEPPGKPQNEGLEITHLETLQSGTGSFCGAHGGIGDDETKRKGTYLVKEDLPESHL